MLASKRSQLGIGDKLANLLDDIALGTFRRKVMHVGMGFAIDAAARVCRARLARRAWVALAHDGFRERERRRSFIRTSGSREQIRMAHAITAHARAQEVANLGLPENAVEDVRHYSAPFSECETGAANVAFPVWGFLMSSGAKCAPDSSASSSSINGKISASSAKTA